MKTENSAREACSAPRIARSSSVRSALVSCSPRATATTRFVLLGATCLGRLELPGGLGGTAEPVVLRLRGCDALATHDRGQVHREPDEDEERQRDAAEDEEGVQGIDLLGIAPTLGDLGAGGTCESGDQRGGGTGDEQCAGDR